MANEVRCKRIINGKTYNTETSTLLGSHDPDDGPWEEFLFKTRHGAYFLYADLDDRGEKITPLEPNAAQVWMEENLPHDTNAIEAEFGEMPEAGDETEARITVRIPESLRKRIAAIADERKQSLNAWIQRSLERSATEVESERRGAQ